MTKLSEQILVEIEKEHIVPTPRWHFLLKNYVFWGLFAVSVLLGSLAFSVIVHIKDNGDWDLLSHAQGNLFVSAVMFLPYFWFVFLLTFASIAYYNWHHTRRGYLIKRRWIFLGSVASSIFLGGVFYAFGFGAKVDQLMAKSLPLYDNSKHEARKQLWQQPEHGMLMGEIVEIDENKDTIQIKDEQGNAWTIDNAKGSTKDKQNQNKKKKGNVVKVVGEIKNGKEFVAKEIRKCDDCDHDEDDNGFSPTNQNVDIDQDGDQD